MSRSLDLDLVNSYLKLRSHICQLELGGLVACHVGDESSLAYSQTVQRSFQG